VIAPASGTLTNVASVSSPTPDPNPTNNVSPPVTTSVTPVADVALGNAGPGSVLAGSSYTNVITVTNLGPSVASNVVVVDTEPNGTLVTNVVASLAAGGVTNFNVVEVAPGAGPLTNSASSTATTGDPNLANNTNIVAVTAVIPEADLAAGKSGPGVVFASSNLTYTVTVTNLGPSTAVGVVVTDSLPAGETFVSATGGGTTNGGVVSWALGTMVSLQVSNVTVTVIAPASGTLTNVASVSSPTPDPNPTNNVSPPVTTSVTPVADVSAVKSGPAGILFGTNFNYTITVSNAGPSTATGMAVTDSLPAGLVFESSLPATTTNAANQVIWPNLGNLVAGATSNLTVTVISTSLGTITNVATVGSPVGDPNLTNNMSPPVVTAVTNNPPVANPDIYAMTENTTSTENPLVNDVVQTPGGLLTIITVNPTNGTATIVGGTNVLFTPATNFIGTATIGYTITDNVGGTNSSLITVTVTNIPPLANPDLYSAGENSVTNLLTPLSNDVVQTPGGMLTIISLSPTNGTATILNGTNVLFTPATNFTGTATIGYTITDNIGGTNSSLITVTVTNRPPLANPDLYFVNENSMTNVLTPLTNDVLQTPGGTLVVIAVNPTNGTATIMGGTNVLFTPATNFTGTTTIGYTITDGLGGTNTSLITVVVGLMPPVANSQSVTLLENTPQAVTLTGSDPNNLPITFVILGGPTNGTLNLLNTNSGSVTYTPNTNYTGADSFTFRVNDVQTNSAVATVTIAVLPVADVAIIKTGPVTGVAGSNLTYIVTATNSGPAMATNVLVSDQLPVGFTFVSASAGGTTNPGVVLWPAFNLAANARSNFTVTAFATATGSFTNIAFSTAGTFDPNTNNNNGTLTNSQVVTAITSLADIAVFKTGNTYVAPGSNLVYTITVTNAGPSSASGVVVTDSLPAGATFVSASGSWVINGSAILWNLGTLAALQTSNLTVTVTAPANGSLTNIASGGSSTPDPNPANNNGTASAAKVITLVEQVADVQITLFGPTNVTVGDGFSYTNVVTNAGPSIASSTLVTNILPTNLVFVSASGGGVFSNGMVTWPVIPALTNGQATNLILTVAPLAGVPTITTNANLFNFIESNSTPTVGFLTNRASAFAATFDPNTNNNFASSAYTNAQVQTLIVPGVFSIFIATNTYPTNGIQGVITNTIIPIGIGPDGTDLFIVGTSAWNPETQLYEENVSVTNRGTAVVHGLRLYVGGLRSGVTLYNATGTNNGVPYVEYDPPYSTPIYNTPPYGAPTNSVTFQLEFFVADRRPFTNSLSAVAIPVPVTGPVLGSPVVITNEFFDLRNPNDKRFLLQFPSIPGRTYTIEYSDDMVTWYIAVPSIVASANSTVWYDDGPPQTLSKPTSVPLRSYRLILDP